MNLRSKNVLDFYLNDFPKLKHFKLVFRKVWLSFYSIYCFGKVPQFFKVPWLLAMAKSRTHHWTMWETETIVTKILKKTMGKLLTRHSNLILLFFGKEVGKNQKSNTFQRLWDSDKWSSRTLIILFCLCPRFFSHVAHSKEKCKS